VELLKNLINNLGYVVIIAFFLSRLSFFKKLIKKDKFNYHELIILSLIFGGFGILGTYIGTEIHGAIANTRLIGVMAGGILAGPVVGILAGLIAGIHRLTIDFGALTAIPCAIATMTAGLTSSYIYKKASPQNKWFYGLVAGFVMESFEVGLILLLAKPFSSALAVVKSIYVPMSLTNGIGISILILLLQNIFDEAEETSAKQAKLALEIANKTLPHFREITSSSLEKICLIIKDSIGADAVSITDKEFILAHVGLGSDHHIKGFNLLTEATKRVVSTGEILYLNHKHEINCEKADCPLKSAILTPLYEGEEVIGTLKIYYAKDDAVSYINTYLALGLSRLISTQLEIGKIGKLKELANKAEIKALQSQINPHFLFNALNTIISFQRFSPSKARELIVYLSTYLRYNIEAGDSLVDIKKELEQVKAYIEIEKARFDEKLDVIYNIDENIDLQIPALIIQPIVENCIKHGILEGSGIGQVKISISRLNENSVEIIIEDDGIGIPDEIIQKVYTNKMNENKIGLSNVHNRLLYIYGKGLTIERLSKGTRTSFTVHKIKG